EPFVRVMDVDADGFEEVVITTEELNLFISPENGGSLQELDYRPGEVNLLDILSRWEEGYHYKLEASVNEHDHKGGTKSIHDIVKVKEEGLEKYLKYDHARRASFVDRFIGANETFETFFGNTCKDLGDFSNGCYAASIRQGAVFLTRNGNAGGAAVTVTKEIRTEGRNSFSVDYALEHKGGPLPEGLRFGVEINMLLPCCDGPACFYQSSPPLAEAEGGAGLGSAGESGVEKISLVDSLTGVITTIEPSRAATLWRFPLHTVSLSEEGFEKIYQGSCLLFLFPVELADKRMRAGFKVRVEGVTVS
ncbi:MAG: DUF1926 domain-containing protein, partial [Deltaproteobacteria bacterium]|nr:DUF1926 domain-containing protein [Deltaproteobacteria bacterium]